MVTARAAALHALVELERGRQPRLRAALDAARLDGREQALANELAHGVLRRERLLDHVLAGLAVRGLPRDARLMAALRLGVYQLLFVAGMPVHAAVHETVELVRSNRGFANALLRQVAQRLLDRPADAAAPERELPISPTRAFTLPQSLPAEPVARAAIVHSLPDFLVERWREWFGAAVAVELCAASSAVPEVFLRPVGCSLAALSAALASEDVQTAAGGPRMLRWTGGGSPFGTRAFREGAFAVQDPTAFAAVEAVPCRPGDRVLDLCAAPGTKTTALGERVRPGGAVYAFDIDPRRRERIVENVARLRLGEVVQVVESLTEVPAGVDAALADVPCSNTGVLARRVEVRQRLAPGTFAELVPLQRRLLGQAIAAVRPGGHVVYSTCSIDREENEDVVAAALAAPPPGGLELLLQRTTLPRAGEGDGGFVAVLRRGLPGRPAEG